MSAKFTVDPAKKEIVIVAGTTDVDVRVEFYSDLKREWKETDALWKYRFPVLSIAGNPISGTKSISPYYALAFGWRVGMPESDLSVVFDGNLITTEGSTPFVDTTAGVWHHDVRQILSADSLTNTVVTGDVSPTPAEIWAHELEGTLSARDLLKILTAIAAGVVEGADTPVISFKDVAGLGKTRVEGDLDGLGNRDAIRLDLTD